MLHVVEAELEHYLFGRLTQGRMDEIERHVFGCPKCGANMIEYAVRLGFVEWDTKRRTAIIKRAVDRMFLAAYRLQWRIQRDSRLRGYLTAALWALFVTWCLYVLGAMILWEWYDG